MSSFFAFSVFLAYFLAFQMPTFNLHFGGLLTLAVTLAKNFNLLIINLGVWHLPSGLFFFLLCKDSALEICTPSQEQGEQ